MLRHHSPRPAAGTRSRADVLRAMRGMGTSRSWKRRPLWRAATIATESTAATTAWCAFGTWRCLAAAAEKFSSFAARTRQHQVKRGWCRAFTRACSACMVLPWAHSHVPLQCTMTEARLPPTQPSGCFDLVTRALETEIALPAEAFPNHVV